MDQAGVRIFLGSMFLGVLYVFGSLAVMVNTAHTYCLHRAAITAYAALGLLLLTMLVLLVRTRSTGGRLMFVLPGTFFLLGVGIPAWLASHAVSACVIAAP